MIGLILALQTASPAIDCDNAMTQADMNQCAHNDFGEADAALNAQWKLTAAMMKERDAAGDLLEWDERPGYFETLLKAQRAWLTYRDAHCASEGYYARGGSLEPLLISGCKARLTRLRTAELVDLASLN